MVYLKFQNNWIISSLKKKIHEDCSLIVFTHLNEFPPLKNIYSSDIRKFLTTFLENF